MQRLILLLRRSRVFIQKIQRCCPTCVNILPTKWYAYGANMLYFDTHKKRKSNVFWTYCYMQLLCSAHHSYDNFVLEDWYIEMLKRELYSSTAGVRRVLQKWLLFGLKSSFNCLFYCGISNTRCKLMPPLWSHGRTLSYTCVTTRGSWKASVTYIV